ncbi:MAG: hypothetical protein Q7T20_17585 [Saprospiraceae bacterium]|nr:hypothetical protein [Saprospiraceae bacterium]
MIKELTELVTLAEKSIPNHEDLLNFLSKYNRDVLKLFHAVQGNSFRTEAEAIDKAKVGERTKFRQVAKELLRCLEQMVLLIDFDKQVLDELNHARIRGFQLMAIVKSLAPLACKNGTKKAAEELLRLGQHYARPEFVVEATKALMDHASIASDDPENFEYYRAIYQEYNQWRLLEEDILIYLNQVKLPYIKKKALKSENAAFARRCINEFEQYVGIIPSHGFHIAYYSLKSKMYMIQASYQEATVIHDDAIQYFSARPYSCNTALNIFYYSEIANCVYLAQYERGGDYYKKALEMAAVGSDNWFNTLEVGFYLRMHEQNWVVAAEIFNTATKHKRFNLLRDTKREIWHILGAYLYIMQKMTGTSLPDGFVPKVKSSKFRNEIKDFTHDKMGMNIAILAAEVLLDFVEEKDDELWDRISALEKYRERYLRNNEDTHRSQLFIKILSILSKYNYDRDKFLEKAEPYLAEMRVAPLQFSNQAHELEIVPYEHLVHAIAAQLKQRWGSKNVVAPIRRAMPYSYDNALSGLRRGHKS